MTVSKFSFKKYQPLCLRLWHWSNFVVILALLATVLIRKTFLSWRINSVLIEEKLGAAGIQITPGLAKEIAVAIRNPLWEWHIYLGYILSALLLERVLIALFIERQFPSVSAIKSALGIKRIPIQERGEALHFAFVKIGYAVFYIVTMLMVVTGILMTFKTEIGLSSDFGGTIKSIHEFMMWFFVVFIAGHIIGIVIAENCKDQGIISDMIHGGKSED